jgi:NagD protein
LVQLGYKTVLVLSGGTRREDLQRYAYSADLVIESLGTTTARSLAAELAALRSDPIIRNPGPLNSGATVT